MTTFPVRLGSLVLLLALIAGCTTPPTPTAPGGSGTIIVSSTPPGAAIFMNRQPTGLETPATISDVPAGTATIRLAYPDHFPFTASVTVEPSGETTVQGVLNQAPPHRIVYTRGSAIFMSGLDGINPQQIASNVEARFPDLKISPTDEPLIAYPTVWRVHVIRSGGALRKVLDFTHPRSPGDDTTDDIAWSPTGRYLVTSVWRKGIIGYDTVTDDYGPLREAGPGVALHDAAYSPDEQRLAFFEQGAGTSGSYATLATMNADGSNVQAYRRGRVTAHHEQDLAWLNDHALVWRDEQDTLHRFDFDTGRFDAVKFLNLHSLRVAPDYSQYAFAARNPNGAGDVIYIMNVANGSQTILPSGAWTYLAWSPTGDAIAATNDGHGVWWALLDGTVYQIIDAPDCAGVGVIE